jgi:transposase
MRPKGSSAQLEQRRRDGLAMLGQGLKPTAVAKALGVSRVSVSRWRKAAKEGGKRALAAKPHPGRPLKLGLEDRKRLLDLLSQGPIHHGHPTQLWTLARVAELILIHFGVSYHPSQVWRILVSLGWSCQKPQCKARERDEQAIAHWRKAIWPRIKKSVEQRQKRAVSG